MLGGRLACVRLVLASEFCEPQVAHRSRPRITYVSDALYDKLRQAEALRQTELLLYLHSHGCGSKPMVPFLG